MRHPITITFGERHSYGHPDLKTQLDAGRGDGNPDPKGGRFVTPAAYKVLAAKGLTHLAPFDKSELDQPGFKFLDVPDIDFRSHCPTFKICLTQIRESSDGPRGHVPLFLLIEAKSQAIPILPGATKLAAFDAKAFDDLDAEILAVLGRERVIAPDDVRGNCGTLHLAVLAKNWPTLQAARGKVMFLMITAAGLADTSGYLAGHSSLRGRMAFLAAYPGEDHAAFLIFDNALIRGKEIEQYVKSGYLVRTHSHIETFEANTNDMTRARAAFDSGALVVSTDFFRPGNVYKAPYVVTMPGGGAARCSPKSASACRWIFCENLRSFAPPGYAKQTLTFPTDTARGPVLVSRRGAAQFADATQLRHDGSQFGKRPDASGERPILRNRVWRRGRRFFVFVLRLRRYFSLRASQRADGDVPIPPQ